jgi:hypothetical protein
MLATVASIALSLPAMAQSNTQPNNTPAPTQQSQMSKTNDQGQSAQTGQQNQRQAENVVRPSQLSKKQIRQIQESLNKKGFDAKHADGIWGRETADALRNFQKQNGLQARGELTQRSLSQLGVDVNTSAQQGARTTGAGSHESRMSQPSQNPGMTNPDRSSTQTNGLGGDATGQGQNTKSQMDQTPAQTSGATKDSGPSSGSTSTGQ